MRGHARKVLTVNSSKIKLLNYLFKSDKRTRFRGLLRSFNIRRDADDARFSRDEGCLEFVTLLKFDA